MQQYWKLNAGDGRMEKIKQCFVAMMAIEIPGTQGDEDEGAEG